MNNEPTNRELYILITHLNDKIERLERELSCLKYNHNCNRDISTWTTDNIKPIIEWTKGIIVKEEHLQYMFETDNNTLNAFKKCVLDNIELHVNCLPIRKHKNRIHVLDGDRNWVKWDDDNTRMFIQIIWQKFIGVDLNLKPDPSVGEEMRDLQRKHVIGMRKFLYDIKKNRLHIVNWIKNTIEN